MKYSDDAYDVLITYNSAHKQEIEKIVQLLKDEGIKPWFDEDICPGDPWIDHFSEATKVVKCVAAFFGTEGVGRWQDRELAVLDQYCVEERKIPLIPVLLPGVPKLPDGAKTRFAGIVQARLKTEIKGLEDIRPLIRAINRAIDVWESEYPFEIEIDVSRAARSCFLALPEKGLDDVYKAVKQAIEEVKTAQAPAIQLIQTQKRGETTFTEEDVVHVIREAELVIAACTPQDASGSLCPEVMYELGMAHALGKPSILVTTDQNVERQIRDWVKNKIPTVKVVKYTPDEILSDGLTAELKKAVKEIDDKISQPFLLDPNVPEIHAFRSSLIRTVAIELPHFRTIFAFGIQTQKEFRDLMNQSHVLLADINELAETTEIEAAEGLMPPQHNEAFKPQLEAFQRGYDKLSALHTNWEQGYYKELEGSKADLKKTFNFLGKHLDADLHKIIRGSQKWCDLVIQGPRCHIEHYCEAYNRIQARAGDRFTWVEDWLDAGDLQKEVKQLDGALGLINSGMHNMMEKLLEIIVEVKNYDN